jgi:hypothetical protein
MEKQVSSNTEQQKQDLFNKTTVFLTKFIFGNNFDMLRKIGYVDSYTSDPAINNILTLGENQRLLFLLFKNNKLSVNEMKKVVADLAIVPSQIVFSYELVNDYCMIVIDFPEKYTLDYDYVTKGMYSKLSEGFKEKFPISRDVFNSKKIRVGKEWTLYYHIFNKTEWLKNFWMERLGLIELDDKLELWEKPGDSDLIFDVKKIISP